MVSQHAATIVPSCQLFEVRTQLHARCIHQASVGALRQLATQLLSQHARYEAALGVLCKGGMSTVQHRAAVQAAQAGLAKASARYTALRGAVAVVNPLLWTWYEPRILPLWLPRKQPPVQVGAGHGGLVPWQRLPAHAQGCVYDCRDTVAANVWVCGG